MCCLLVFPHATSACAQVPALSASKGAHFADGNPNLKRSQCAAVRFCQQPGTSESVFLACVPRRGNAFADDEPNRCPGAGSGGQLAACPQAHSAYIVSVPFGAPPWPCEGWDSPVEIHTSTPGGLSVFPLLYSSEFYSFFVWGFSDCLMIFFPFCPDVWNSSI